VKIRWSIRASEHLIEIFQYIAQDKPDAAAEITRKLIDLMDQLAEHPRLGRPGRVKGTRELLHPPFVIMYAVEQETIDIRAVLHGRRRYD
jgi:plasmid stabilization system protein ParE